MSRQRNHLPLLLLLFLSAALLTTTLALWLYASLVHPLASDFTLSNQIITPACRNGWLSLTWFPATAEDPGFHSLQCPCLLPALLFAALTLLTARRLFRAKRAQSARGFPLH